jgi:hypothetical protein
MSRTLGVLAVLAALLLSFNYLPLQWLDSSLAPTNPSGERISLAEELNKAQRFERQGDRLAERIAAKEEAAERYFDGELTLFELAARFRALHEECGPSLDPHGVFQATSEEVAWCRGTMSWLVTKVRFEQSPGEAEVLSQRLEDELKDHMKAHDGRVVLPQ